MSNYTAVFSGGSKGIGADLAERLLERGYRVVSIARGKPEWEAEGCEHIEADLRDPASVAAVAADIAARYDVTHLVHNAGLIWPNLIEEAKPEDITGLAQLHLGSALTLLQAFLPAMKERGFGRVMFNASRAALGAPTRTAYSASKAGVMSLAECMHADLRRTNVEVQLVNPGFIKTRLTDKNDFHMPSLMEPEDAARAVFEHMNSDGFKKGFPKGISSVLRLAQFLPDGIYYRLFS